MWDFKVPDDIGRDNIHISSPGAVFSVKVKPGSYKVWIVVGNSGGRNILRPAYIINAEGKKAFDKKQKYATYLDAMDPLAFEYKKANKSLWDIVAAPNFEDVSFETLCNDGVLDISIMPSGSLYLCALVIWPANSKKCDKIATRIKADRKKSFDEKFRLLDPVKTKKYPKLKAGEKKCGFILSTCNYLKPVPLSYVPKDDERFDKISILACPDEYEPAVFVISPLRDQKGVELKVSDLKGRTGTIPASSIKIERAIYRYVPESRSFDCYTIKPWHLVPQTRFNMEKGVPVQIWVTVKVPDDAHAGKYNGTFSIGTGEKTATFALGLEVYPFKLEKPEAIYAHAYMIPKEPERIEMDLQCMKEHGFNSVTPKIPSGRIKKVGGKLQLDFSTDDLFMDKMKKAGMTGPVPLFGMIVSGEAGGKSFSLALGQIGYRKLTGTDAKYLDDLTELTRVIKKHAKEKEWLPVLMYPSSEISNDLNLGYKFNNKLIEAIRKAGDVRIVSSVNHPTDTNSAKYLDVIMYNAGVGLDKETIEKTLKTGCELWFQNIGGTRFNEGLYLLRTGAKGRRQWVMNWYHGNPYSDFQYSSWSQCLGVNYSILLYPSKKGTLGSIGLERMREGVDDYCYFQTLRHLIEKAKKLGKGKEKADAAKKEYDEMIASAPIRMNRQYRLIREDGLTVNEQFTDQNLLDRYRRCAAQHIIKLTEALGNRSKTE